MKHGLQSRRLLPVEICRPCGGGTFEERRPLEENTQWKLSFPLGISVVEQRETKGQRRGERESRGKSLTRSTKHLRDARPLVYFCKKLQTAHWHTATHPDNISVCNETWQWPKEDCLRRSVWQLLFSTLTQDSVNTSLKAWIFYQEYDLLFLLQTPHCCSTL